MSLGRRALALSFALMLCAASRDAAAGDNVDRPAAEALFKQGLALVKAGDFEQGCPKFDAALALWPSAATALNIARCHEHFQRTASAWSAYHRALSLAKEADGLDRRKKLRERAEAGIETTEPRLARLNIIIDAPQPLPPSVVIERDGVAYPRGSLGVPIPVDPQATQLTVRAEGYLDFTREVLPQEAETTEVHVVLEPAPKPAPQPAPIPPPPPALAPPSPPQPPVGPAAAGGDSSVPLWAWIAGASGVALGAASVAFLIDDLDAINDLKNNCDLDATPARCLRGYDVEADNARKNRSLALSIGFGAAGAAALTAGIVGLVMGSGSADTPGEGPRASLFVTPWGGGAVMEGRF